MHQFQELRLTYLICDYKHKFFIDAVYRFELESYHNVIILNHLNIVQHCIMVNYEEFVILLFQNNFPQQNRIQPKTLYNCRYFILIRITNHDDHLIILFSFVAILIFFTLNPIFSGSSSLLMRILIVTRNIFG